MDHGPNLAHIKLFLIINLLYLLGLQNGYILYYSLHSFLKTFIVDLQCYNVLVSAVQQSESVIHIRSDQSLSRVRLFATP